MPSASGTIMCFGHRISFSPNLTTFLYVLKFSKCEHGSTWLTGWKGQLPWKTGLEEAEGRQQVLGKWNLSSELRRRKVTSQEEKVLAPLQLPR